MTQNGNKKLIIKALKKGDIKAFEKIYTLYYEKLCQYLLNYTRDRAKIEDAVQDTFITLWKKRKTLNIKTSPESYLFRTAYNTLMDRFRKKSQKETFLLDYYHTALMRAENETEDYKRTQRQKLKQCIATLPERSRDIFQACKLSKQTNQDVAENFAISLKTVEGHITKAFKLIKKCVEGGE